jgi:hypothetical protein
MTTPSTPPPFAAPYGDEEDVPSSSRQTIPVDKSGAFAGRAPPMRPREATSETKSRAAAPVAPEAASTVMSLGVPHPSLGGDTDFDPAAAQRSALAETSDPFEPADIVKGRSSPSLELDMGDVGDALDLVGRVDEQPETRRVATPSSDPLVELRERYALGDFSGALEAAEAILQSQPTHADAQRYAESCRGVLEQMYVAKLGALDQVPVVAVPVEQLRWLTLDHRAGFLLSHIDGVSSLEEILDVSGMPRIVAMKIIHDLMQQKVIVLQ